ncbi:MAG TPA: nucleoside diphosphate kinase regulator [Luteimonas sp.]|nr:nucleoside diphosphate kinase regulator [Luteimonas sp.]
MQQAPSIVLSARDARRLEQLIEATGPGNPVVAALEAEIARAEIREPAAMPTDVVTMNSEVLCFEDSGAKHALRLVYPRDADAARGHVSVLAPVGAALLGLSVGQSIEWPLPGGRSTRIRVSEVVYQPEAAGVLD